MTVLGWTINLDITCVLEIGLLAAPRRFGAQSTRGRTSSAAACFVYRARSGCLRASGPCWRSRRPRARPAC